MYSTIAEPTILPYFLEYAYHTGFLRFSVIYNLYRGIKSCINHKIDPQ
jgi:hypothetical protein